MTCLPRRLAGFEVVSRRNKFKAGYMVDRESLLEKLQQIQVAIKNNYKSNKNIGVLSGISGIALFQYYYSKFLKKQDPADLGAEIIYEVVKRINNGYLFPTFCTGIAGAGWVLDLLQEENYIEVNNDSLLPQLDDYLFEVMENDVKNQHFDFLHGALGYGYYFLKRYENTQSEKLKKKYREKLIFLLLALKNSAKKGNNRIWWEYELNAKEKIYGANLSLSHGMSSIVIFLCKLHPYDDFKKLTKDLLIGSVTYILKARYKDVHSTSLYPSWIYKKDNHYENTRLAWCYGDLGVGLSIYHTAKTLRNTEYKKIALQIFKHSAKRRDYQETRICDAGLCHGVYGIVAIFKYIFTETKETIFKEALEFWINEAVTMAVHEDGYAGYKQWRGDDEQWENKTNLLEGVAGIGLAIITYLAPFETHWEECLLIK